MSTDVFTPPPPIAEAAYRGDVDMVKNQLSLGIAADTRVGPFTILHTACRQGHPEVISALLDAGADIEREDEEEGVTPLIMALECLRDNAVQTLLDRGADVEHENWDGMRPLHWASKTGSVPMSKLLISKGAEVDADNGDEYTALTIAIKEGNEQLVQLFIEHGADVNKASSKGKVPLHYASGHAFPRIAEMLIEKGADIYAFDYVMMMWPIGYAKLIDLSKGSPTKDEKMATVRVLAVAAVKLGAGVAAEAKAKLEMFKEKAKEDERAAGRALQKMMKTHNLVNKGGMLMSASLADDCEVGVPGLPPAKTVTINF